MRKARKIALIFAFAAGVSGALAATGHGGGYAWKSGADAPAYSWVNPDGGTEITSWNGGYNDGYGTLNTPFEVHFFGNAYAPGSNLYVGTNGFLGLSSSGMTDPLNVDIPESTVPNNYMALFWDDLVGSVYMGAKCRYKTTGSAPNRAFVITYKPWFRLDRPWEELSFQILIYENDGTFDNSIRMQYEDVYCGTAVYDEGASATVGLENPAGTDGCKFSYNTPSLENSFLIEYRDVKPTRFNLLTPPDGTIIDVFSSGGRAAVDVDFTWEKSTTYGPGAITYRLLVDDSPNFGSPEYELTGLTDENATITFYVTETETYYWRVIAKEGQYNKTRRCNADFEFAFNYNNIAVQPGSLGRVKAGFR